MAIPLSIESSRRSKRDSIMARTIRGLLVGMILVLGITNGKTPAQPPSLASTDAQSQVAISAATWDFQPSGDKGNRLEAFSVPETSGLPAQESGRQWPFAPPAGWFTNLQADVVTVVSQYQGQAPWSWTVVPHLEVGYRFAAGNAWRLSFQSLNDSGATWIPTFVPGLPQSHVHLRASLDVLRLDYVSCEHFFWEYLRFRGETGLHATYLSADTRTEYSDSTYQTSDAFIGGGIHGGLDGSLWLGQSGLALFSRLILGGGYGTSKLTYANAFSGNSYQSPYTSQSSYSTNRLELDVLLQAGLRWTVLRSRPCVCLATGYHVEDFYEGTIIFGGNEVGSSGLFLRCEVKY
jgi:hypothetical protein